MALLERLAILITADATQAVGEMKKIGTETEANMKKAGNAGQDFSGKITKVSAGMLAAGAGLLAIGVSAASSTVSLGKEVLKLERYTGLNAESASKLDYAAKMSGVSTDSLAKGLGFLSKNMAAGNPEFEKLGINVKDTNGKLRSIGDILPELADKFAGMANGTEKTAAVLKIFGRSGMDLLPFLNKGSAGIKELSDEAQKMGLVLSQDNVSAVAANIKAQRELGAAFEGLKVSIGNTMLPLLTQFEHAWASIPGPMKEVAGPLVVFGGLGLTAAGGLGMMVGQIGKLGDTFKSISGAVSAGASGLRSFVSMVAESPMAFAGATAALIALSVATAAYQKRLNDAAADGRKAVENVAGDGTSEQKLDNLKKKLDEVNGSLEKTGPSANTGWSGFVNFVTGSDKSKASLDAQKKSLEDQIDALQQATPEVHSLADAEQAATDATTGHVEAMKAVNDALHALTDPLYGAISATNKLADAQNAVTDANKAVYFAQVALNDAVKQHGPASQEAATAADDLTNAQKQLRDATVNSGQAAIDYETSLNTLKGQMQQDPAVYQQNIDKINSMEASHQISAATAQYFRDRVNDLAGQIGQLPTAHNTNVSVTGAEDAFSRIYNLNAQLARLDGHAGGGFGVGAHYTGQGIIRYLDGTYGPGGAMGGRAYPGAAMGSRIGGPRLVGELGPEIFWPDTAGTIVPNGQTQSMMAGGRSSAGSVSIGQLHLHGVTDFGKFVEQFRQWERLHGPVST